MYCNIDAEFCGIRFNSLTLRQNGRDFTDDIIECIFCNKNARISLNIFVPKGQISNIPALIQIKARRRPGDKPLFEAMMAYFADAHMRHPVSMR